MRFDDERSAKAEEDRKLQHYGMFDSRANLDDFKPGVDDEMWPCRCGKYLTMGGRDCDECRKLKKLNGLVDLFYGGAR